MASFDSQMYAMDALNVVAAIKTKEISQPIKTSGADRNPDSYVLSMVVFTELTENPH